ncbi:MAG TPA: sulfatase [Pirellulales bacterium]|jgi:arylsulfatase A-like enzyme|nr:sulfatase [Pirellulales bacterium]
MRSLAVLACLFAVSSSQAAPKFNVLFIATDDWNTNLGCYGTEGMHTPNVDKFAASAVRFDRAYCQFPLCNPSRTSMLTGRYPTATGVLDNEGAFREKHPNWVTLPQFFHDHGYVSARTGKIFHGGIEDPKSWDEEAEYVKPKNPSALHDSGRIKATFVSARQAPKKKKGQDPTKSDRIVVLEGDGQEHQDWHTAEAGIALLEKYKDQPFFIGVGFHKPHSPPTAPQKFFDLYDASKIALPPDFAPRPTVPEGFPPACLPMRNGDLFINRDASPESAREMIRAYRASCSWTDWNVGRVLDALDRLKLADKTIVVFFGDHGYHLGEKGKWSKHASLFEVALRVPMAIRIPGAAGNGKACERTVQMLDVYPTLVEACGLPMPKGLQGHSLMPLLDDPNAVWDHPAISVKGKGESFGRSIRTERWRYSDWETGGALLTDEKNDPHETKNLVKDPKYADVVSDLKGQLDRDLPKREE